MLVWAYLMEGGSWGGMRCKAEGQRVCFEFRIAFSQYGGTAIEG